MSESKVKEAVRDIVRTDRVSRTTVAIDPNVRACANCVHVHMRIDLMWECWKSPPTAVAAWVQDRSGSMNLQVGGARAPVERDAWCGEFTRKTDS
jgi:hypothetical protein